MSETPKSILKTILTGFAKVLALCVFIGLLIFYSDYKGYFNPDQANDHTKRKWDTFYAMTEKNIPIDVMLFGNSHLYTGINPKNLSAALGATAFIFASPGTNTVDNYFALKEAIKVQKPSLVIVETYGLNDAVPHELKEGQLSNQIVSFSARKDFLTKLISTPVLFAPKNYLYAWSTTLRNHDYIFTNPEQLKINRELIANNMMNQSNSKGLYLGRYVRFTSGIEQETLNQYESLGAPVDGEAFSYSKEMKKYTEKIIALCQQENIELMFLTLPMYDKHIKNYSHWRDQLATLFQPSGVNWFNLQTPGNYKGFGAFAFENTYNESQHMTYNGSILATYKLATYIRDSMDLNIPDRTQEMSWHQMFYGQEGYFENYYPANNDDRNNLIATNKQLQNFLLNSLSALDANNGQAIKLIARIDEDYMQNLKDNQKLTMQLSVQVSGNGTQVVNFNLNHDTLYKPKGEIIFTTYINNITLLDVVDGQLGVIN